MRGRRDAEFANSSSMSVFSGKAFSYPFHAYWPWERVTRKPEHTRLYQILLSAKTRASTSAVVNQSSSPNDDPSMLVRTSAQG
jgi:hypothetical protein